MEIKDWMEKIRGAKTIGRDTFSYDVSVRTTPNRQFQKIVYRKTCTSCAQVEVKEVCVEFSEPVSMSIFQAVLLLMLFSMNLKPRDYARYHETPAGQAFIKKIKKVI